jgi:hypothetical protein
VSAARTAAGRLRPWLSVRHSRAVEVALVGLFYALYEAARGLVAGNAEPAMRHAHEIISLERALHVSVEGWVQQRAETVPGLLGVAGVAYLTLHVAVTAGVLIWLYRRRPDVFPRVRTTLLFASILSLAGFLFFPTAPPRLAAAGLADTVSRGQLDLNEGLVSALYNPYAAVPSMHIGYALVVGVTLVRHASHRLVRAAGAAYPPLVLFASSRRATTSSSTRRPAQP